MGLETKNWVKIGKFVKHTTIQLKRNLLQVAITTDTEWMYYDLHYYTPCCFSLYCLSPKFKGKFVLKLDSNDRKETEWIYDGVHKDNSCFIYEKNKLSGFQFKKVMTHISLKK